MDTSAFLPLHDGGRRACFDEDVLTQLEGAELRLLAGRIVGMHHNAFFDLQNSIGGGGTVTLDGDPFALRRSNLGRLSYAFGRHGELQLGSLSDTCLCPLRTKAGEKLSLSDMEPLRLDKGRFGFLPFELTRSIANIAVDAIHNQGTVLTLSHWPANRTPSRYRANLSTQSALRFLEDAHEVPGATILTTDHFDIDGLMSVYAFMAPDHARRNKSLLIDIGRLGDFARGRSSRARRAAFALTEMANRAFRPEADATTRIYEQFRAVLPKVAEVIDDPDRYESLWRRADSRFLRSADVLDATELDEYPEVDLAIFRLPTDAVSLQSDWERYFGLSEIAFHNRTRCATLAIVHADSLQIHQRYEGWVERVDGIPRARRDLGIFGRALQSIEDSRGRWVYEGVEQIMPMLAFYGGQTSAIPVETILSELRIFLQNAPPAWRPCLN